jgi:hypothetical protein
MDCIQAGLETKVTRACRLPPCASNTSQDTQDQHGSATHITVQDIQHAKAPTSLDQVYVSIYLLHI